MSRKPPPSSFIPPLVGILSDDLTGANAVAAMFAARGVRAGTLLGVPPPGVALPNARVLVIDTDTRDAAPPAAYQSARGGAVWLRDAGTRLIAKRIDSTLRGPIGAEVAAVM